MVTDYFFVYSYFFQFWTMKIQKIKNFWDMEIIGNRRKIPFLHCFALFYNSDFWIERKSEKMNGEWIWAAIFYFFKVSLSWNRAVLCRNTCPHSYSYLGFCGTEITIMERKLKIENYNYNIGVGKSNNKEICCIL